MKPYSYNLAKGLFRNILVQGLWLMLGITLVALRMLAQDQDPNAHHKSGSSKSAGFVFSGDAKEKDLGLPLYPGSRQHKDGDGETAALNVGLWGGSSGFRLVVLKLESGDSPDKIAVFYHKALNKYGAVLECGKSEAKKKEKSATDHSSALECDDDHPEKGGVTLKSGTKEKMHVVGIEPNGKGTLISLVYVEAPKSHQQN